MTEKAEDDQLFFLEKKKRRPNKEMRKKTCDIVMNGVDVRVDLLKIDGGAKEAFV